MQIWVDADACPVTVKQILFKAAKRTGMAITLVANQPVSVPRVAHITAIQVSPGFDVADNEIVRRCQPGDLVVTQDIPLAAEVIGKGGLALDPRGELYTEENIGPRLNIRDFMDTLRTGGVETSGPPALSQSDRNEFANHLNELLSKNAKDKP